MFQTPLLHFLAEIRGVGDGLTGFWGFGGLVQTVQFVFGSQEFEDGWTDYLVRTSMS